MHGVEVGELRLPPGSSVSMIIRDGETLVPERRTVLKVGDDVAVAAEMESPAPPNVSPDAVILDIREAIGAAHGIQVSAVALVPPGTIPKTTSGKLQRFACREGLLSGRMIPVSFWAAAS